ncbi:hypothetical protein B0H10DRAFT_1956101 [Mycena sp. CBHHK59/15]|nr:hypothetical protein B0H10DRAFT_1956101 [Mycena sp. CBHHK59/15]
MPLATRCRTRTVLALVIAEVITARFALGDMEGSRRANAGMSGLTGRIATEISAKQARKRPEKPASSQSDKPMSEFHKLGDLVQKWQVFRMLRGLLRAAALSLSVAKPTSRNKAQSKCQKADEDKMTLRFALGCRSAKQMEVQNMIKISLYEEGGLLYIRDAREYRRLARSQYITISSGRQRCIKEFSGVIGGKTHGCVNRVKKEKDRGIDNHSPGEGERTITRVSKSKRGDDPITQPRIRKEQWQQEGRLEWTENGIEYTCAGMEITKA